MIVAIFKVNNGSSMGRSNYKTVAVVVGDDEDDCKRKFVEHRIKPNSKMGLAYKGDDWQGVYQDWVNRAWGGMATYEIPDSGVWIPE